MLTLRKPYLVFLGDVKKRSDAKTALGLVDWCADDVLGELALTGALISTGKPKLGVDEAAARGAGSLVIGVAPVGGSLPAEWVATLVEAARAGMDIVSGLHARLTDVPELVAAAQDRGVQLHDVRHAPWPRVTATGRKRPGRRVLTVGTDCALGKKYTALALTRALNARGSAASFRATGQTGVLIAGSGVALDAVVSDFIAGVAEQLSPANEPAHWDVIEGQGSLFHPAYAGVTLGLLHGSQPDAFVLCHDPARTRIEACPDAAIPPLHEAIDAYVRAGRVTNAQIRCVGISINSSSLDDAAWAVYRQGLQAALGLPVVDPMRGGVEALAEALSDAAFPVAGASRGA